MRGGLKAKNKAFLNFPLIFDHDFRHGVPNRTAILSFCLDIFVFFVALKSPKIIVSVVHKDTN